MSESNRSQSQTHDHGDGVFDPTCDEERDVIRATLASFFLFRRAAHWTFTHRRRRNMYSLPNEQQEVLKAIQWGRNLDRVDLAIETNAVFAEAMLRSGCHSFGIDYNEVNDWKELATAADLDKTRSTLKQFLRDWSEEGAVERELTYGPILLGVERLFADISPHCDVRILVPGAGLGRLAFELARRGYCTEGNEFSFHQLIASNFILNHTSNTHEFTVYPFCHGFSHHRSHAYHLRPITVPDVHPATELNEWLEFTTPEGGHRRPAVYRYKPSQYFSMSAGEFVASYNTPEAKETFDCVATCFFIDTARNFLDYLETIRNVLREGGAWINHGPLLWHYEGSDATETKDQEGTRRRGGDLRGFDQVQASVEDAETPRLPDGDERFTHSSFGSSSSSRTRVDPGEFPAFVEAGPSSGGSTGGEAGASTSNETSASSGYIESSHDSAAHSRGAAPGSAPGSNRSPAGSNHARSHHSHHSDEPPEWNGSLEFTLEDIIRLIDLYGFELIDRQTTEPSGYINDVKSMGRYIYESEFWIAVKRPRAADVVERSFKKFNIQDDVEDDNNTGSGEAQNPHEGNLIDLEDGEPQQNNREERTGGGGSGGRAVEQLLD
ncbi:hypothetical protein TWF281_011626 [Arthrobotrys megalospora]